MPIIGGATGVVEPDMGETGSSGCSVVTPTGGGGIGGISTWTAKHLICGSPEVPGGHMHTGRWSTVLHSAFSPQIPRAHAS